jgi:hypothetical protein
VELESQRESLRKRGLGLAGVSYDAAAVLKDFAARRGIGFPLLSDPDSAVIRRFGLLNTEYAAGTIAYGVPYPGTFVTDAKGIVREKFFEKTYPERRTAASVLVLAGEAGVGTTEIGTGHFTLHSAASNVEVFPGNRITLVLDFEMAPGRHAYAPGVKGYRPLALRLAAQPLVTVQETVYPASRPYVFAPLQETVPVFEGRFRLLQDITLAGGRDFAELLQSPDPTLVLEGTLDYQVCSETACYPPGSLPVRWTFKVRPLDRERPPEPLRRKDGG